MVALFAAAAVVVPTLMPVATTDDWAYARSAQILLAEGRLEIFPVVAATAVFQIVWGALFGLLFGPELGVFRLSTVVMTAIGAAALYGLCRHLGATAGRAALGAAAYLFNPLAFALAFSFMTDPHFAALMLVATLLYARGLEPGAARHREVVTGSVVAALALLTRQQGILIPLAVATYLLASRRLTVDRSGLAALLRVGAIPAATALAYLLWLRFVNDVPAVQASFLRDALAIGWGGTCELIRRLPWVELAYVGLFALPLTAAALPSLRRLLAPLSGRGLLFLLAWQALLVGGVASAWATGARMPYIGQFFGRGGIGPPDVLGSRPILLDADVQGWLTAACTASALVLGLVFARRLGGPVGNEAGREDAAVAPPARRERAGAALILAVALWQVAGVLPPSYQYIRRGGSLDRYLLPLLPLAICLALWALRDVRLSLPVGWLVVAAFALFSVAGTRDYLVYMGGVWDLARYANDRGVPNDRLDAGSGWDGYHLYEYSRDNGIGRARTRDGPWWVYFYAPATDSTFVVSTQGLRGYLLVSQRTVSQWLETEPVRLYLLRRSGTPWPPGDAAGDVRRDEDGRSGVLPRLIPTASPAPAGR